MLTANEVRTLYDNCVTRARSCLAGYGLAVQPKAVSVLADWTGARTIAVRMSDNLYLQDWPQRPGSSKRLQILLETMEEVDPAQEVCRRSRTRITYFRVIDGKAVAVESLHFDYAFDQQAAHAEPVCHAQTCVDHVLPPNESFRYEIDAERLKLRCQTVRLPSGFINTPGVLTMLAADHLTRPQWTEFMANCIPFFDRVPKLPLTPLVSRLSPAERLAAWGWYDR